MDNMRKFEIVREKSICMEGFEELESQRVRKVLYFENLEKMIILSCNESRDQSYIRIWNLTSWESEDHPYTADMYDIIKWKTLENSDPGSEVHFLAASVNGSLTLFDVENMKNIFTFTLPDTISLIRSTSILQLPNDVDKNPKFTLFLFVDYYFRMCTVSLPHNKYIKRKEIGEWSGFMYPPKRMMIFSKKIPHCVYVTGELGNAVILYNYQDDMCIKRYSQHREEIEFIMTFWDHKKLQEILIAGSKISSFLYFYHESSGFCFRKLRIGQYTGYENGVHHLFSIRNNLLFASCESDDETYCINLRNPGGLPISVGKRPRINDGVTFSDDKYYDSRKSRNERKHADLDRLLKSIRIPEYFRDPNPNYGQRYNESKVLANICIKSNIFLIGYWYDYKTKKGGIEILKTMMILQDDEEDTEKDVKCRVQFLREYLSLMIQKEEEEEGSNCDFIIGLGDLKTFRCFLYL